MSYSQLDQRGIPISRCIHKLSYMMDDDSRIDEFNSPGFITGKPLVWSHGRETATAKGVTICIREAAKTWH